ncbi:MAG: molybdenum cofactor guanylyltransferase [Clostridium sp.]
MKIKKSVIILSGGKATRLNGFPKSHLLYNNKTFIEKILEEVEDYEEKFISSNSPFLFRDSKIEVIEDEVKNIGPIGGIYTCLKRCTFENALVIGVDMPFLSKNFLNSLGEVKFQGNILIPISSGRIEPFCGIYKRNVVKTIEENILKGEFSIEKLIKEEKTVYIEYLKADNFTNINTFRDYERLSKLY